MDKTMNDYFGPGNTTGVGWSSAARPVLSTVGYAKLTSFITMPQDQLLTSGNPFTGFFPVYSYLVDAKHNKGVVAGNSYDGRVYHQAPEARLNSQWQAVSAGDGYIYLIDRKFNKALVAGANFDGRVYHQDHNGQTHAQWILEPGTVAGAWLIKNRKHAKYLVTGDNADGQVYLQDHRNRSNAHWQIGVQTHPVMQFYGGN